MYIYICIYMYILALNLSLSLSTPRAERPLLTGPDVSARTAEVLARSCYVSAYHITVVGCAVYSE